MAILEFVFIAGLGVLVTLLIVNTTVDRGQKRQLDEAFYRLIETQRGRISLIQLAAVARVNAEVAKRYLEEQATVFSALPNLDNDGNIYYQFPQLKLPPRLEREW